MADPIRQLLSQTSYDTDGTTTVWNFSFAGGYLDKTHVKGQLYDAATGVTTAVSIEPGAWLGPWQLSITPALPSGKVFTIYRDTPKNEPIVNFVDTANLTEVSLDINAQQAIFVAAEAADTIAQSLTVVADVGGWVAAAQTAAVEATSQAGLAAASSDIALAGAAQAAAQVDLAAGQVVLASQQVTLAATQVDLAANQVGLAEAQVDLAEAAAVEAQNARDAALIQAGVYKTDAAGLAAVAVGDAFKVENANPLIAATEKRKMLSPNIFNKATARDGRFILSTGSNAINAAAGWGVSAFIPVTPGQLITISGVRGREGVGFFATATDSDAVPGTYVGTTTLPLTVTVPVGAAFMALNLYSATSPTYTNVQVEVGAAPTTYQEFGAVFAAYIDDYPNAHSVEVAQTTANTALNKDYDIQVPSPNLFDKTLIRAGKYVLNSGLGISNAAGWGCSPFIPVTPGEKYTISGQKGRNGLVFFHTATDADVVTGSYNNSAELPLTVTAPAGAAFMAVNIYSNVAPTYSDVQIEQGAVATPYVEFGKVTRLVRASSIFPPLPSTQVTPGAILVLTGEGLANRSYVEANRGGRKVRRTFTPWPAVSQTVPSVFNFSTDLVDGVTIRTGTDDVAPYRALGATVGANHGFIMTPVAAAAHGKTQADIGSVYAQGASQYVIVGIPSAGSLYMTARASNGAVPSGTLTHVSGGSSTTPIASTAGTSVQWYPPFKNRRIKLIVDGVEVTERTGTFAYRKNVTFVESYDLMDKADIVGWFEANGASGVIVPNAQTAVSVSMSYVFDLDANCTVYSDFLVRKDGILIQDIMFLQAGRMTVGVDGVIYYYIPKTLPVTHMGTNYNFALIDSSDVTGWTDRLDFTPARCEPSGLLPDRMVMLTDNFGFAIGYLPVQTAAPSVRRANASVKALQMSNSSGKIYMSALDRGNGTLNAGDYFSVVGYRNILIREAGRTCSYVVRMNGATYVYADWHAATTDRVPLPEELAGRSFEVVEKSSNVTVLSQAITGSVSVSVGAGGYGYLILKVS